MTTVLLSISSLASTRQVVLPSTAYHKQSINNKVVKRLVIIWIDARILLIGNRRLIEYWNEALNIDLVNSVLFIVQELCM